MASSSFVSWVGVAAQPASDITKRTRLVGNKALFTLGRAINVNGQWLNPQQIAQADEIAGFRLPNGFYWWNPQACAWGVVGNPVPMGPGPCGDGGGGMGGGSRPRVDWNRSGGPVIAPGDCEGGRCVNIPPDLK